MTGNVTLCGILTNQSRRTCDCTVSGQNSIYIAAVEWLEITAVCHRISDLHGFKINVSAV
jgi:hypothetical protein